MNPDSWRLLAPLALLAIDIGYHARVDAPGLEAVLRRADIVGRRRGETVRLLTGKEVALQGVLGRIAGPVLLEILLDDAVRQVLDAGILGGAVLEADAEEEFFFGGF